MMVKITFSLLEVKKVQKQNRLRQKEFKKRRKALGLKRHNVYVHDDDWADVSSGIAEKNNARFLKQNKADESG